MKEEDILINKDDIAQLGQTEYFPYQLYDTIEKEYDSL